MNMKIIILLTYFASLYANIFLQEVYTSGQINITNNSSIFYWHFLSRSQPEKAPLIFSLQGGPGVSSLTNVFMGNGPYSINKDLSLNKNDHSWNNNANVVYVDQPVGTGLSFALIEYMVTNLKRVGDDFFSFLVKFYDLYPQYQNRKVFLQGASYAGHYLSYISQKILEERIDYIKFKGILLISGWVNPSLQESSQIQYALKMNLLSQEEVIQKHLQIYYNICIMNIQSQSNYQLTSQACGESFGELQRHLKADINIYNIQKPCQKEGIACTDFSKIEKIFKIQEVKDILKITKEWEPVNIDVYQSLQSQEYLNTSNQLEFALEKGINLVIVYGEQDLMTNYLGGNKWVSNLNWKGREEFESQKFEDYCLKGVAQGKMKSAQNLKFILVKDSGHDLPADQPQISSDIFENFISSSP